VVEVGLVLSCYTYASFHFVACYSKWFNLGEKLMGWGYRGEVQCVFCRSIIESRGLFFFLNVAIVEDCGESF
jgi:hypothetical protein